MDEIQHLESITQMHQLMDQGKPRHPLVTIIDFSKVKDYGNTRARIASGFYGVMMKSNCLGRMKYGRQYYDFEDGTMVFIGPGQVISVEEDPDIVDKVEGWGLFFHPDLLRGTSLSRKMKEYSFFAYESNEALHLSDQERKTINDCIDKIDIELGMNIDKHSQTLIVSNIELLLNYCTRYYDRQFITRKSANKDTLTKFEDILTDYFNSDKLKELGLPTVKYCAEKLFLSSNYLSDLLKKETGKNAQEHIHYFLIEEAKNRLLLSNESVSSIAYDLGFDYPQYFSKFFKKKTGMTPASFRNAN
ncbi:AraC family transcriptional regulator [Puteibacter caeruleilacunae]|nr:AraC family transcriptional regulator [Puteibacter caeruleilacunae]